jgi:hypothetical protein
MAPEMASDEMITNWLPAPDARGPVTCDTCGCRLESVAVETWRHFPSAVVGQDARGCRPPCADAPHDRFGRVLEESALPH